MPGTESPPPSSYLTDENVTEFAKARRRVEARVAGRLDDIRRGRAMDVLVPYAKAYLGLYLDLDNRIDPEQRVRLLAGPELADAVLQGLHAAPALDHGLEPRAVGRSMAAGEAPPAGFTILAGMDRRFVDGTWEALPRERLAVALACRYANRSNLRPRWAEALRDQGAGLFPPVLAALWAGLVEAGERCLPELRWALEHPAGEPVLEAGLETLLASRVPWSDSQHRALTLRALATVPAERLLEIATAQLDRAEEIPIRQQVGWHALAFLLDPVRHGPRLAAFCGQSRIKVLPLLDFVVAALEGGPGRAPLDPGPEAIAQVLRIVAPAFSRNQHPQGGTDAIARKVLWLFDRLGADPGPGATAVIRRLGRVRVLRNYADVIEDLARGR